MMKTVQWWGGPNDGLTIQVHDGAREVSVPLMVHPTLWGRDNLSVAYTRALPIVGRYIMWFE